VIRQQVEVCFASLKRIFGLGETLEKTLVGLGDEDRGEGGGLRPWSVREPAPREAAGAHQGFVDLTSSQHSSSGSSAAPGPLRK